MTDAGPRMPDAVEWHRDTSAGRIRSRVVGERRDDVPKVVVVQGMAVSDYEPPDLTESHVPEWRRAGLRGLVRLVRVHLRDRIEEAVPALRAPVLVLRGGQDRLTTAGWARGLAESAHCGRYREVPGAHSFLWADPAVWSARSAHSPWSEPTPDHLKGRRGQRDRGVVRRRRN
jgi:pimeloyl-ACP methyl ester carboxylesterase